MEALAISIAVIAFLALVAVWLWRAGSSPVRRDPVPVETRITGAETAAPPPQSEAESITATNAVRVIEIRAGNPPADPRPLFQALLAEPPARDPVALAVRMGRTSSPPPRVATSPRSAGKAVGETDRFWVHDIEAERYFSVTARLEVLTQNATFWVQEGLAFNREDLTTGAEEFAGTVMPKLRRAYGSEWSPGIDDDPRVVVLHHQNIAGVAGYFSSPDEFTRLVEPYSNEHEMFNINLTAARPGSFEYLALLSHEFQHMIHWNTDPDESVWANEGLSELAPHLVGYGQQTGGAYLGSPDTPLLEWETQPHANAVHYAASYLFFAYLRAQYGDAILKAFDAAQPNGPDGVEAAIQSLGKTATFEETFVDWVVANVVHGDLPTVIPPSATDVTARTMVSATMGSQTMVSETTATAARFSYGDQDVDEAQVEPWPGRSVDDIVGQFATDYWDVTTVVSGGQVTLGFAGDPTTGLLGAEPQASGKVWWSGRGENMDSRLTRAFDLSGVTQARVDFRMWYDVEENWDFAYFMASTDDGAHWQRLPTNRTTDENPNGNNYGDGLTGESGGWVDESIDLTPFAGKTVQISFEVLTDDAVSQTGLALDDIRLEAIGFHDDVQGATDGWQAEGFRMVDPLLPQHWGVQAIVIDEGAEAPGTSAGRPPVSVHRFATSADGTATIRIDDIPGSARVIVAISGLTPATREEARYRLHGLP